MRWQHPPASSDPNMHRDSLASRSSADGSRATVANDSILGTDSGRKLEAGGKLTSGNWFPSLSQEIVGESGTASRVHFVAPKNGAPLTPSPTLPEKLRGVRKRREATARSL